MKEPRIEDAAERVQLLVRVPKSLHRSLKHAAIDRDASVNDLVIEALERWWTYHARARKRK
jgi:predicted HicB family RNase H-like nuclease